MPGILITGAGGFIGSYLCRHFSNHGYTVIGWAHRLTKELSEALPGCNLSEVDILCSPLPAPSAPLDIVIHTATANEIASRDVEHGMLLSALGTRNLLDWASANGEQYVTES